MPWITGNTAGPQPVARIVNGVSVAPEKSVIVVARILLAGEPGIANALRARHHLFFAGAVRGVRVVMILMHRQHGFRRIHNFRFERARLPEKPVVPPESSDGESRHVRIETAGKSKIVDAASDLQLAVSPRTVRDLLGPVLGKNNRVFDVDIRPSPDHQKSVTPPCDMRNCSSEV